MIEICPHILVVDDDKRLSDLLKTFLKDNEFWVTTCPDTKKAREMLSEVVFDLIVLDVMMPDETGLEFLLDLRKSNKIPVLMLSALGDVDDRVQGLETGADDYMAKPFEPKELVLRIKRLLERSGTTKNSKVKFGEFEFDINASILRKGAEVVYLTENEAEFIKILAQSPNQTVLRSAIANTLETNERTVDVQIGRIRKKIEDDPKTPRFIQTVRGEGYSLRTLI